MTRQAAGVIGRGRRLGLGLCALLPAFAAADEIGGIPVEDPFASRPRIVLDAPPPAPAPAARPAPVPDRAAVPVLPRRDLRVPTPADAIALEIERQLLRQIGEALYGERRGRRGRWRHFHRGHAYQDDYDDEDYDDEDYDDEDYDDDDYDEDDDD